MRLLRNVGIAVAILITCGTLFLAGIVVLVVGEIFLTSPIPPAYEAEASDIDAVLNRVSLDDFATFATDGGAKRLLLITLDTLRADHLSAYGYIRPTSPFLDSLAAEGVLFSRAYAPMSTTAPSHATMLSGLYPLQHRVLQNGHQMPSEIQTLAEILTEAGFTTAGIVSTNRHFVAGNIAQGFTYFNEPTAAELYHKPHGSAAAVEIRYRTADKTLDQALQWLAAHHKQERIFLWIHLFDTHLPYVHRSEIAEKMRFRDPHARQQWVAFLRQHQHIRWRRTFPFLLPDQTPQYERYDEELRFLDERLRDFFARAEAGGIQQFFTIITADHGEGLGDHNYWQHSRNLYNAQLHVPLIVRWPDGNHGGRTIDTVVEHTDIMPTFLWEARVPRELIAHNRQYPIEGMPLQYLLENNPNGQKFGYAFAQRQYFSQRKLLMTLWINVLDRVNILIYKRYAREYEYGEKYAIITNRGKYIHLEKYKDEFYLIENDEYEQNNKLDDNSEIQKHLASTLIDLIRHIKKSSLDSINKVDKATIEALKALGYVQ